MDATSAYLQEAAMAEKVPLIISVKRRLPEKVNVQGWPVVSFEVETEKGALLVQMTSQAVHEMRALIGGPPPRIRPSSTVKL
jgi:hypothetical protein